MNTLTNLVKCKKDDDYDVIDESHLYVKDINEAKYKYLLKKHEKIGLETYKDPKTLYLIFIQYAGYL